MSERSIIEQMQADLEEAREVARTAIETLVGHRKDLPWCREQVLRHAWVGKIPGLLHALEDAR